MASTASLSWAHGNDPLEGTRDYDVPIQCPTAEQFNARVEARRRTNGPRRPAPIRVVIRADGKRYSARMEVGSVNRTLEGSRCDAIVDALSLIAALIEDTRPGTEAEAATVEDSAEARVDTSTVPKEVAKASPSRVLQAVPPRAPDEPKAGRWVFSAGVHASVQQGVLPGPSVSLPVFLAFEDGNHVLGWSPRFRIQASVPWPQAVAVSEKGMARFELYLLRLDACPFRAGSEGTVVFGFCAGLEGGVSRARSAGIAETQDRLGPWFVPALLGRLHTDWLAPFRVELEGSVGAPFVRTAYWLDDARVVHRVSPATASLSLGVGAEIP